METLHAKTDQLQYIAQRITDIMAPEFIICYGGRTIEKKAWGAFINRGGQIFNMQTTYDVLIITGPDCKYEEHEVIQMVNRQFTHPIYINCIAHRIGYINNALEAKSRFYQLIMHHGQILYASGRQALMPCSETDDISISTADWGRWFAQAEHFFSLAGCAYSARYYGETLFLLHQALENACNAMLRFFTGYHNNTHNLCRLLTMTETFSPVPRSIFPGTTKEEIGLLDILNRSYSDARYKETYTAAPEKVEVLKDRVKAFITLADTLYKNGPQSLNEPWTVYSDLRLGLRDD